MSENFSKSRIVKNSVLLYVRMLFTMWINLYATRLVLANLGVDNLGVYGVVGSIVNILALLSAGLTNSVQRFITYETGRDGGDTNIVFCSSLNVIFIVSGVILLLLETVGLWLLYNKVDIPEESVEQAFWVYQFSALTCIVNLISIPYNALVIAHEKMDVYAVISIVQVVLTCFVAWCLSLFSDNRLFIYAALIALVSILVRLLYQIYCHVKFEESRYHFVIDGGSLRQIGKFTGITSVSGIMEAIYNQGIILVINWSFGVALNAVYTIAMQLKNAVMSFAFNIFKAVSPQITKTYASGEFELHKKLVYGGSRLEIFMIYFILIPFLFRTEYILHLWLDEVPEHLVSYARFSIFISLIYALFEPIRTSVLASNKISSFMIIPNGVYILVLPLCYLLSQYFHFPIVLIGTILAGELVVCLIRIYLAIKVTPITMRNVVREVGVPSLFVAITDAIVCWGLSLITNVTLGGILVLLVCNSLLLLPIIYFLGITPHERSLVYNACNRYNTKIIKKLKQ